MLKPKMLKPGDVIGIIAPSSPTPVEKVQHALEQVKKLGFRVKMGQSCYESHGYLAGKDSVRARDINEMFADQEVNGIICIRGGYGAPKILDQVDFEQIKYNPKVFVGYSDITALHLGINQISGFVTFHGPMASSDMSNGLDGFSKDYLIRSIMGDTPLGLINNPPNEDLICLVEGEARGEIVGGNLALVAATMGTPYEIDTRGKILFLEDIGEEPYRIDRMLTQLALAGKISDASGIILGDWNDCEPKDPNKSLSLMEVFKEILIPYGKPTIYNLQAGHCTPKITLPFGVQTYLNTDQCQVIIEESGVVS